MLRIKLCLALFLLSFAAHGDTVWTTRLVRALPVFAEDRELPGKSEELARLAELVDSATVGAPRSPREWSALMLTVAFHESGLSHRIIMGRCKPLECDRGRARGIGQNHRNTLNATDWNNAPGNLDVQVRMLDAQLRRAYWTCARSGVPWYIGTLNAYAGQRCGGTWRGLPAREATFARLIRL